ncbi:restriction endonuclease subunit S [Thalassotalea sp. SU-HH00458]|uniref:restriction endonuclease subunit S n=1 Tax=Thalassotalea sp. SU-HH00458 TaxID=3127657 RepID=UPI0031071ADD
MMKAYPEYKDSGVEWVGQIPMEWNVVPLHTVCSESKLSNKGMIEENLVSLSYGKIIRKDIQALGGMLPDSFETYQIVNKNNIIFRGMDLQNDKRSLRSAICRERGIITSAYIALIPEEIIPEFLSYIMRSYDHTKVFYNLGSGMRQSLKFEELKRLPLILPPRELQLKIVEFLDDEIYRIDNLISEKENFIKLLSEKRQALISHIVTKGLNPNMEMKYSGVEWIGEIPEHWEAIKLKFLCDLQTGSKNTEDAIDEGKHDFFVRSQKIKKINSYSADCEAVLTAGDGAGVGKVYHYVNGKFDYHQRVYMMNNFKKVIGKWFYRYLSSMFYKVAMDGGAKSTVDSLRMPTFMNFMVCVPPIDEQKKIITYLDKSAKNIESLERETLNSIELLKEHRIALISAAVTGKIDVREEV